MINIRNNHKLTITETNITSRQTSWHVNFSGGRNLVALPLDTWLLSDCWGYVIPLLVLFVYKIVSFCLAAFLWQGQSFRYSWGLLHNSIQFMFMHGAKSWSVTVFDWINVPYVWSINCGPGIRYEWSQFLEPCNYLVIWDFDCSSLFCVSSWPTTILSSLCLRKPYITAFAVSREEFILLRYPHSQIFQWNAPLDWEWCLRTLVCRGGLPRMCHQVLTWRLPLVIFHSGRKQREGRVTLCGMRNSTCESLRYPTNTVLDWVKLSVRYKI
jgi:hypothetical protein